MVKYVRKLLIVSGIKNLYLYVQKKPLFFPELCKILTTPLVNPFVNPISSSYITETSNFKNQPFYIGVGKNDNDLKRAFSKFNRNLIWKEIVEDKKNLI